ncbi:hypothetical protein [Bacteroides stercorirosoris]|uniref:hypothetical protein n=1 Tax=Bacteroides stercorirosoris TaxID=871324 RepID=UPI003521179E
MILILSFLCYFLVATHTTGYVETPSTVRTDDDIVLQYQQFIREDAKEHRLFLENSFNKLLMLISGGTFLFGSLLTWLNYRTRTEIKTAVNKKFDEQIGILIGTRIDELRQNSEIQSKELEKRIVTADKLIRELSGRLSLTSSYSDGEIGDKRNSQQIHYTDTGIKRILWVDDNPANNRNIVGMFPENEVVFDLAKSTNEAIEKLVRENYTLIISYMKRNESPDEGIQLLRLRNKNIAIYLSSFSLHPSPWQDMPILPRRKVQAW